MSVECFFDTNVLVYAASAAAAPPVCGADS